MQGCPWGRRAQEARWHPQRALAHPAPRILSHRHTPGHPNPRESRRPDSGLQGAAPLGPCVSTASRPPSPAIPPFTGGYAARGLPKACKRGWRARGLSRPRSAPGDGTAMSGTARARYRPDRAGTLPRGHCGCRQARGRPLGSPARSNGVRGRPRAGPGGPHPLAGGCGSGIRGSRESGGAPPPRRPAQRPGTPGAVPGSSRGRCCSLLPGCPAAC